MQHYSPHFREIPKNTHTKDAFDEKTYPKTLPITMPEPILNKQSDDFDRFGLNTRSSRRDERIKTESARIHEIEYYIPTDLRVPKYINQNSQSNSQSNGQSNLNGILYSRLKKSSSDIDKPVNIRDLLPGTYNNILHVNDMKSTDTRRMHRSNDISDREPMRHKLSVPPSCYPA